MAEKTVTKEVTTAEIVDNTIPARSKKSISSIDDRVRKHDTKVVKIYLHKKDNNLEVKVEKNAETITEEA